MNLDHITVMPRWSMQRRNRLLCPRCNRRIGDVIQPLDPQESYHLMFAPAWAKVADTGGRVWAVSERVKKKERDQSRRGNTGSPDVYVPAARRDREIDAEPIPPEGFWIRCSCDLDQKVMLSWIEPAHVGSASGVTDHE